MADTIIEKPVFDAAKKILAEIRALSTEIREHERLIAECCAKRSKLMRSYEPLIECLTEEEREALDHRPLGAIAEADQLPELKGPAAFLIDRLRSDPTRVWRSFRDSWSDPVRMSRIATRPIPSPNCMRQVKL